MTLEVDSACITQELETLASFSDASAPAVTRVVFTDADLRARTWLKQLCTEAGLEVREDAVGNMFARWTGADASAPGVGTGSHIDAIPNAGRYDGTVGVLGGLEAIRALKRSGFNPARSIELLLFTSEEPTRFGIGCLGSRLLSGSLSPEAASQLTDTSGESLDLVRRKAGFDAPLSSVALQPGHYAAFVELHIEQGPRLEQAGLQLGIVTSIAAPATLRIVLQGEGGHAGAVLMHERRDALTAAADIIVAVEASALRTNTPDTVATTGICEVFPGAVNSIPSRVTLGIDLRDIDLDRRDAVLTEIQMHAESIARTRHVSLEASVLNADAPGQTDPKIVETLTSVCGELDLHFTKLVSRAYHDSLFMSRVVPTAMLFIPCRDGISHRPDEHAAPLDIANGVRALAHALHRLAS